MRIIGFMVCGPGEADRYLHHSLQEFARLCDDAVIATNNADDKTKDLIRSYGFWQYEDNREWGKYQPRIKQDLLSRVAVLCPDWIIAIDSDEAFAPAFTRQEAEALACTGEIAYYFLVVNHYNDEQHFAHGAGIQRFWNVRFFKYAPQFSLAFQNTPLHCGLAPAFAYEYGWHAPFYLSHFGLMLASDRKRKADRYKKYDPKAEYKDRVYYDDLDRECEMRPFDGPGLLAQLRLAVDCQPRATPYFTKQNGTPMKFHYVKRVKDGRVIDVPETDLESTLKRTCLVDGHVSKMFDYIGEVDLGVKIETPVAPKLPTCPLCGWEGKTEIALKGHKTKQHA